MNRVYNRIPLGEGKVRHVMLLTDTIPCVVSEDSAKIRLAAIFEEFSTNPHLISMSGNLPKTLRFFHNGRSWSIELETVVDQE
jgi:hypothetical protein